MKKKSCTPVPKLFDYGPFKNSLLVNVSSHNLLLIMTRKKKKLYLHTATVYTYLIYVMQLILSHRPLNE